MQAAIDRVFRSFSRKPPASWVGQSERDTTRDSAEALAERLLENFKAQVSRGAEHRH